MDIQWTLPCSPAAYYNDGLSAMSCSLGFCSVSVGGIFQPQPKGYEVVEFRSHRIKKRNLLMLALEPIINSYSVHNQTRNKRKYHTCENRPEISRRQLLGVIPSIPIIDELTKSIDTQSGKGNAQNQEKCSNSLPVYPSSGYT